MNIEKSNLERLVDCLDTIGMSFKILKNDDNYDVIYFDEDSVWVSSTAKSADEAVAIALDKCRKR